VFIELSRYLQYYGYHTSGSALKALFYVEKERYLNTRGEYYPEFDIEAVFRAVLRREGLNNPFLVESCCKLFRMLSRERFRLYPDSLPALKEIKSHSLPMAMLSNAQNVFFLAEIDMLGLRQFFSYYIVSSTWGFRKPDPRLFSVACTLFKVQPEEAVYIGDDAEVDVRGAQSIGMQTALIDRRQDQKDRGPKPDYYTVNLRNIWEWLGESS
jgi:putative hydrolase of the HAD superfamily